MYKRQIVPSWEGYPNPQGRAVITLDPGMAFGTGTHETTALCLETLDALVAGGERVLDIGTGSGILAIAALKLGAAEDEGVDIDPMCCLLYTSTLQQLAAKFGLSVPYLSKLLKTAWGCGFAEILQHVRLERAKELLVTTALPITEISASVGYENDAYFISIFKKAFGITPQNYRREKTTQP